MVHRTIINFLEFNTNNLSHRFLLLASHEQKRYFIEDNSKTFKNIKSYVKIEIKAWGKLKTKENFNPFGGEQALEKNKS